MPNFDALRTSTLGALSYICKPQPPAELICCYPFNTISSPGDISTITTSGVIIASTYAYYGTGLYSDNVTTASISFARSINLALPWTLEYMLGGTVVHADDGKIQSSIKVTCGNLVFQNGGWYQQLIIKNGDTYLSNAYSSSAEGGVKSHYALTYDGTHVRHFLNGNLVASYTTAYSGINRSVSFISSNYEGLVYVTNFRMVQKQIGTSSSFPVPTSLYTGYEPL